MPWIDADSWSEGHTKRQISSEFIEFKRSLEELDMSAKSLGGRPSKLAETEKSNYKEEETVKYNYQKIADEIIVKPLCSSEIFSLVEYPKDKRTSANLNNLMVQVRSILYKKGYEVKRTLAGDYMSQLVCARCQNLSQRFARVQSQRKRPSYILTTEESPKQSSYTVSQRQRMTWNNLHWLWWHPCRAIRVRLMQSTHYLKVQAGKRL
jgi:hypothetical protein